MSSRRQLLVAAALLATLVASPGVAPPACAQIRWENDFRVSYEHDDNVREDVTDAAQAQVARFSLRSDIVFDDATNQLTLLYQGGYKRYFNVTSTELDVAGQFINEGEVGLRRRLGRSTNARLEGGLRDRTWEDEDVFFVNEDGFTQWWAGGTVEHAFAPAMNGQLGLRVWNIDFDHVDEVFGYDAQSANVGLSRRLGLNTLVDLAYVLEQRTYDGRAKLRDENDDPSNIFAPERPRQIDLAHDAGIGLTFLQPFGFQARYRYRRNLSNSFGFDYFSHIFSLQLAQPLPWRMLAQFYGSVELRQFDEEVRGLAGTLDVEDTDNNVFVFRLLKELNGHMDLEARYGHYTNESINLNDFYTKNIYSLGFRVRP